MNACSTEKPRFHLQVGGIADVDQYIAKARFQLGQGTSVVLLRGANMTSMARFYDELAAALQLPLYFGRNWNALDECLVDFEWMPSDAYVLVFADAPSVLKEAEQGDAEAFWKLLSLSSEEWAAGISPGGGLQRKPTPFHVILHAEEGVAQQFSGQVAAAIGDTVPQLFPSDA